MRAFVAIVLLAPVAAYATAVLPLTLADLAARSDTVVRARVLEQQVVRSEKSGRLLTRTRLAILETFKGGPQKERVLEQMGGTLGGETLRVPGDATLAVGEEAVLFLRCEGDARCHLFGLGLGKLHVEKDGTLTRETPELTSPDGNQVAPVTLRLDAVKAAVKR